MRIWFSGPRLFGGLIRPGISFALSELKKPHAVSVGVIWPRAAGRDYGPSSQDALRDPMSLEFHKFPSSRWAHSREPNSRWITLPYARI
jgi:hypothetical protein